MKKPLEIVIIVVLFVLILFVFATIIVNIFADGALKAGIEIAATKALNVGVSVGKAHLGIFAGKIEIRNLSVDNPPGYQHDKLLELKNARIEVDIRSLMSDSVDIRKIKLDGADVVLEQRGVGRNNLQDVIKTIKDKQKAKDASKKGGKKLRIDSLEISDITVKAKLIPVPGKIDTITLKLDPIVMTDLGGDKKLDTAGLSGRIMMAVARGVAKKGTGVLPKEMTGAMKLTLGMTVGLGKTAAEKGKKILGTGKDSGMEVVEGVKDLIKKPEQEKEE